MGLEKEKSQEIPHKHLFPQKNKTDLFTFGTDRISFDRANRELQSLATLSHNPHKKRRGSYQECET